MLIRRSFSPSHERVGLKLKVWFKCWVQLRLQFARKGSEVANSMAIYTGAQWPCPAHFKFQLCNRTQQNLLASTLLSQQVVFATDDLVIYEYWRYNLARLRMLKIFGRRSRSSIYEMRSS